jgi:rSAM/selenodomain-associated transferase 1
MSALIVFARAPERGTVKTRLAAALGDDAALALYLAFLDDVCRESAGVAARTVLSVAGDPNHPSLVSLATAYGLERVAQGEGDLGARMLAALERELGRGGPALVIGSDAPTVLRQEYEAALRALADHEVALGPSHDGGYWLIGVRAPEPQLFTDVAWSTPSVLETTERRLAGRRVARLPGHDDVDDAPSLARLADGLRHDPSAAPATRRALATLGLL